MKLNNAPTLFAHCSIIIILILLFTAGCMQLRPPAEQAPAIYLLEANFNSPPAQHKSSSGPVAVVAVPSSAPGYDTDQMAYMRTTSHLEYFTKSRWADAPALMLMPLVVKALEQHDGFRAVASAPSPVKGDYLINLEVIRFLQEFTGPNSRMRIALRVEVVDRKGILLASKLYDETEPTDSQDAVGGVLAANRLLERLLPEIAAFCADQARTSR